MHLDLLPGRRSKSRCMGGLFRKQNYILYIPIEKHKILCFSIDVSGLLCYDK